MKTHIALRTGVVLAAGLGSRLRNASAGPSLKPLTPVGGVPLIQRTVRSLELAGCDKVVIVLGHARAQLQSAIEHTVRAEVPIQFVVNEHYERKNGLSVLAAAESVDDSFLLTMSDHVFGDEVMRRAARHTPPENGASLVVDYKLEHIFDMEDATKVKERNGLIVTIGKELDDYNCVDTGLFICTPALMTALRQAIDASGDVSLSQGVQQLARVGRMSVVDIGDGFWQDIDTPSMLEHAERMLEARDRRRSVQG